tara:strand:+ start:5855 stop:6901 length:1047 start_codon:yes stop_codon:yes gene_type:complete
MKLYSLKNKRILITGNSGFVGSYLSMSLNLMGSKVYGYSLKMKNRNFLSNMKQYKKKITTINDDLININKHYKKILHFNPEIIIHLASQPLVNLSYIETSKTYKTNILGTVALMELIKKLKSVKHVLVFTSDKVYENTQGKVLSEKSKLGGLDPYSASKSSQDIISNSYKESFFKTKINFSIIRAGNIIGGGDWNLSRLVPDIYNSIISKKKVVIRNPNAIRPWQHILDVIGAIILILYKNKSKIIKKSVIYNIGPDPKSNLRVIDLIKKIKKISNSKHLKFKVNKIKFKETKILRLSNQLIKKSLGWKPKLNINKTIELTNIWYEEFSKNKNKIFKYTEKQILNFLN